MRQLKRGLIGVLWFLSGLAQADLIPPGLEMLQERIRVDPGFYNEADQFCLGKALGARCMVDGAPFDGGGAGTCRRKLEPWQRKASAECVVDVPPVIDRAWTSTRFQLDQATCRQMQGSRFYSDHLASMNASCEPVPVAADQFCDGRKEGDACIVKLQVNGKALESAGRCASERETREVGYREFIERPLLLCKPRQPVVHRFVPASPPSSSPWYKFWP